jgi:hypothetical protein
MTGINEVVATIAAAAALAYAFYLIRLIVRLLP